MNKFLHIPGKYKPLAPFYDEERKEYPFQENEDPSVWAENSFHLVSGYSNPSKQFRLRDWQVNPVNAIKYFSTVIFCGPVQTGKSLMAEICMWYALLKLRIHGMVCYAKTTTAEDVFQDRFKPTVEQVPYIKGFWSGNPDDLTKKKIVLKGTILRIASAQVKNDIASFSAGFIYASEVCKYRGIEAEAEKRFDVLKLLRGRQEEYRKLGKRKAVFESSPYEEGDPLHREMYRPGVLNLEYHIPCPICGTYQQWILEQIKEKPNTKGECDHDTERIRNDRASFYSCVRCGNDIPEESRAECNAKGVWAAVDEKIDDQGVVQSDRSKYKAVSFHWNRLIDFSFSYSECLARFFEAHRSGNIIALRDFLNEDMAQFWSPRIMERSSNWLMGKIAKYKISDEFLPAGVLVVVLGCDTQDNGFFFVLRGIGAGMKSWLLDCDFIKCDMGKENSQFEAALTSVNERIGRKKLITGDGVELGIALELWDRGGHKADYVDYITARRENSFPYIGSKEKNHPLVRKSTTQSLYFGNTENLGKITGKDAENDNWFLAEDTPKYYMDQFVKQYTRTTMDRFGNERNEWTHGGNDHLRDCENYAQACIAILNLREILCDGNAVDEIEMAMRVQEPTKEEPEQQQADKQQPGGYFAGIQQRWGNGR